jgi:hypothetical protein
MTSSDIRNDGPVEEKKGSGEISALEEEVEVVQAQQPLSVKYMEMGKERTGDAVGDAEAENGGVGGDNGLPFSKARCIALVATVTGAAFLNVRSSKLP